MWVSSERQVYVVYGPPMSGKSTFIRENLGSGDIVVDMNQLYASVSMLPYFDKPDNLFTNVIEIHNQLIDNIKTRHGKWNTAWIVGGYADKYKREKIATDLGAELIFSDISKEECIRRLKVKDELKFRRNEWIIYIDKWFNEYMK